MIIRQQNLRRTVALLGAAALLGLSPVMASAASFTNPLAPHSAEVGKFVVAKASAYAAGTADNGQWAGRTAIGTPLRSGAITSAAADWSKFPLGTKFRVVQTGRVYLVDDYGSAMVGKVKVDLFTPSTKQMDQWGVRNVTLEILEWGNREKSLALLSGRTASRYSHIRKMVASLREQLQDPSRIASSTSISEETPHLATRTVRRKSRLAQAAPEA
jgi:3D (Asp-Asp-Asp) domain-containing protein